jgi:predicted transcriptional regulator
LKGGLQLNVVIKIIGRKDFEEGNFLVLNGAKKLIFDFLKTNSNNAYTRQEIAKEIGISEETIKNHLNELKKKGFVEGKIPYYIIKPELVKKDVKETITKITKVQKIPSVEERGQI